MPLLRYSCFIMWAKLYSSDSKSDLPKWLYACFGPERLGRVLSQTGSVSHAGAKCANSIGSERTTGAAPTFIARQAVAMCGDACNAQNVRRIAQQPCQEIPMSSTTHNQLHKYLITTIRDNRCRIRQLWNGCFDLARRIISEYFVYTRVDYWNHITVYLNIRFAPFPASKCLPNTSYPQRRACRPTSLKIRLVK